MRYKNIEKNQIKIHVMKL